MCTAATRSAATRCACARSWRAENPSQIYVERSTPRRQPRPARSRATRTRPGPGTSSSISSQRRRPGGPAGRADGDAGRQPPQRHPAASTTRPGTRPWPGTSSGRRQELRDLAGTGQRWGLAVSSYNEEELHAGRVCGARAVVPPAAALPLHEGDTARHVGHVASPIVGRRRPPAHRRAVSRRTRASSWRSWVCSSPGPTTAPGSTPRGGGPARRARLSRHAPTLRRRDGAARCRDSSPVP